LSGSRVLLPAMGFSNRRYPRRSHCRGFFGVLRTSPGACSGPWRFATEARAPSLRVACSRLDNRFGLRFIQIRTRQFSIVQGAGLSARAVITSENSQTDLH
jgi:hypothetical protein